MNIYYKILCLLLVAGMLSGCLERIRKEEQPDKGKVIARVSDAYLYQSDVKGIFPPGTTPEDSLTILEAFAGSWVRRQVKLEEAERVIATPDIDDKVRNYRNSLLTQMLDKYYVDQSIDTLVTESEVADYYSRHKEEFKLDRALVKGRIVRAPNTFRQHAQLKELMGAAAPEKQQSFLEMCAKNNLELSVSDTWVPFRDFLSKAPTIAGRNYDYMLTVRKVQELSDTDNKYYIQIGESVARGEEAPAQWAEPLIKSMILSQRRAAIIREYEETLYRTAQSRNRISINVN